MAARLGALILAIAMVVGSLALRSRIDRSRTTVRLTCATELADACRRIGQGVKVTVEPAGQTADRLAAIDPGADPELDGWLTPGRWAQMVDAPRTASGREALFGAQGPQPPLRLAQTRVALAVGARRAAT